MQILFSIQSEAVIATLIEIVFRQELRIVWQELISFGECILSVLDHLVVYLDLDLVEVRDMPEWVLANATLPIFNDTFWLLDMLDCHVNILTILWVLFLVVDLPFSRVGPFQNYMSMKEVVEGLTGRRELDILWSGEEAYHSCVNDWVILN